MLPYVLLMVVMEGPFPQFADRLGNLVQAGWVRKFSAGVESIKNAPKSGQLKSASSPRIVEKNQRNSKIWHKIYFSADCQHCWNFKSICIAHSEQYFEIEEEES